MTKVFKTHNQQLKILRNRRLDVPTNGTPKRILERENYYNVINGYKDLFLTPGITPERYKRGAKFSEIYALYVFDSEIKMILLKRILRVENNIKSAIAYEFSKKYGHENYLKMSNFEVSAGSTKAMKNILELIKNIQGDIARQVDKHDSIKHYMSEYGYVPFWVLVKILTLGTVSRFYRYMKQPDRQAISRKYGISDSEMVKMLLILTLCRNICAHDERLYNFKSKEEVPNNRMHTALAIPLGPSGPICGKRDLFAVIITLKFLLSKSDFKKMTSEINKAISSLNRELNTININDVMNAMGFQNNWLNIERI